MSRLKENKNLLLYGLPCVYFKGQYILFSPYTKKTLRLSSIKNKKLLKKSIENKFGKDFFGKPVYRKRDQTYNKLTLITTTDCNLNCRYCSVRAGEKKDFMSASLAKKAIDEIIKQKTKKIKIIFFGGEPTVNFKCIKESVDYVKSKNIKSEFAISTNGILSDNKINFLCKNKFIIQVSADGIPRIQDYQRPLPNGRKSSKIIEDTIKKLVNQKAQFKIRETITNLNVDKMAESVKYYSKLGVKYIFFEPLIPAGKAIDHKKIKCPTPKKYINHFNKALNAAEKAKIKIGNSLLINLLHPSTHYCGAALGENMTITPKGLITACTAIQDDCSKLSKIMTTGRYNKEKEKFEYNLKRIQNLCNHNVENINKCSKCFAKYICSGGCIIRNLVKSGALEKTNDEYCEIRKNLLKLIILRMSGVKGN